jgi:hypothetical protein
MRTIYLYIALLALPTAILANTYHVPQDYPLLQSAIDASAGNDTILCDSVKDVDTIKIVNKVNLVVQGTSPTNPTTITKVLLIEKSTCGLEMLSFAGAKGVNGNNNNSCRSVPAMDGKAGNDAIIVDSSTVTFFECKLRGGDGGGYGVSYQNGMVCDCGAKGLPGTALRASDSHISLAYDSLLSGQCSAISLAGCFTNNCTESGFGCVGLNGSIFDTIHSRIDTMSLDATSSMGPATSIAKSKYMISSSASLNHSTFVSMAGRITIPSGFKMPCDVRVYDVRGNLVWHRSRLMTRQFDVGREAGRGIFVVYLQRR